MSLQAVIVGLIVVGCAGYAVWALMPAVARRAIAGWLLKLPMPARLLPWLKRSVTASSAGCGGCDSCESTPKAGKAATGSGVQPIVFHPRRR